MFKYQEGFNVQPTYSDTCLVKDLRLSWNPKEDCSILDGNSVLEMLSFLMNIKSSLMQAAGKICDLLGIITLLTLRVKCLFQELWKRKILWDDKVPADIQAEWHRWYKKLPESSNLRIPQLF